MRRMYAEEPLTLANCMYTCMCVGMHVCVYVWLIGWGALEMRRMYADEPLTLPNCMYTCVYACMYLSMYVCMCISA